MARVKRRPALAVSGMFLAAWLSQAAVTGVHPYEGQALAAQAIDADAAAAIVRRATGGQVLRVEPVNRGGNPAYRVRVLLGDGRVRVVTVDANTGRLSSD